MNASLGKETPSGEPKFNAETHHRDHVLIKRHLFHAYFITADGVKFGSVMPLFGVMNMLLEHMAQF